MAEERVMKKRNESLSAWKLVLWIAGMLIILGFAILWYWVVAFDTNEEISEANQGNQTVTFVDHESNTYLDSWETIIKTSDEEETGDVFTGATCSCNIVNNNNYNVKDWKLRIEIEQDCYLNSFWCGSFEVHQFRDGKELINLIENSQSDISSLDIDRNIYTDSSLIHLQPGDYLVYIPSVLENEDVVSAGDSVGIGFIFYYHDRMDLSHWTLNYSNDLKMTSTPYFLILIVLTVFWLVTLTFYLCLQSMANRIKKQMNSRIKTLSIMADLYLEAYMIDISENTAYLIKGDEKGLVLDLPEKNVQKALDEKISLSCQDFYIEKLLEFLDFSTVMQRMDGLSSITFEYEDKKEGWKSIRLFRASEDKNNALIVLSLQDIDEEKKKLRTIEERMRLAEYKQNVSGSFLENVSFALNDISKKVIENGIRISESPEQESKELAKRVVLDTRHINLIQNTLFDLYEIECKGFNLNIHTYNIFDMADELYNILKPYADDKDFDFTFDIDKGISPLLKGDSDRIEQILVIIIFSAILMTQHGYVKFSLFGKRLDNEMELIFSVRDTAMGFTEKQLKEIHDFINGSNIETFDNASLVYLKIINGILKNMDSELNIVSVLNEGSDFYFTLRQTVADK